MRRVWITLLVFGALLLAAPARAQGLTGFLSPGPLAEPHADLDSLTQCAKCHDAGKGVSATKCLSCHDEERAQVQSKKGFHADKGTNCQSCHLDHRGRAFHMVELVEAQFDHDPTGFPLRGGHGDLACGDCHEADDWKGLSQKCESCHDDLHGAAKSTRALARGCVSCHTEQSWLMLPVNPRLFDHGNSAHAGWALEGAHEDVACEECHADDKFLPTPHDRCLTCHQDPHGPRFGDDCTECHTVASWRVGSFDHSVTGFTLVGQHRSATCKSCHGNDTTRALPHEACADCHDDPHRAQFAPRTCEECHTVEVADFRIPDFDHASAGWPLDGAHAAVACSECHGVGAEATYAQTSGECVNCHEDPHERRFEPTTCDTCHTTAAWGVDDFDHGRTDFPLTGEHADVACESCHEPHQFSGLAHAACTDCHADHPHDETVGSCEDCHETAGWAAIGFDHATTAFALAPAHTEATCTDCHELAHFAGEDVACVSCHEPHRPPAHYEGACGDCHRGAHWQPADLGPLGHAVTGFELHGTHERLDCVSCHAPGAPKGAVATSCVDCHSADDIHRNLLGDACGDCHTESTWVRTRWRHQLTGWPLRGAHRLAACDDCHGAGYVGTPTECATCHYTEAPPSVPAHQSPQFLDCESCHKPYTWATSGYPH